MSRELKAEMQDVFNEVRRDMASDLELLSNARQASLATAVQQLRQVIEAAPCATARLVESDLGPMREEVSKLQSESEDRAERLEARIDAQLAHLLDELRNVARRQEEAGGAGLSSLGEEMRQEAVVAGELAKHLEAQLIQIASTQHAVGGAVSRAGEELEALRGEARRQAELAQQREEHMNSRLAEQVAAIQEVLRRDVGAQKDVHSLVIGELTRLRGEIGRVQQAMNLDFDVQLVKSTVAGQAAALREFAMQTETVGRSSQNTQTDEEVGQAIAAAPAKKHRKSIDGTVAKKKIEEASQNAIRNQRKIFKPIFADLDGMKSQARELVLVRTSMADHYRKVGWAQAVARSTAFEHTTFALIALNSLWIAVEMDNNNAESLIDAPWWVMVIEQGFCACFFIELVIRLLSFERKRDFWKSGWFVFDMVLVSMMVFETWIIYFILLFAGHGNDLDFLKSFSVLRMTKLVRLTRVTNMVRLLRRIPELVVLVKAVSIAGRSVFFVCLLLFFIIYCFAIAFRQLTEGSDMGEQYFRDVPSSMNTLLLEGILPNHARLVRDVSEAMPGLWLLMVFFVLLTSLTVLNMLVGVLVEVVSMVASAEKEGMSVSYISSQLREVISSLGYSQDEFLTKQQFQDILVEHRIADVMSNAGVDSVGLLMLSDVLFEDMHHEGRLSYGDFFEIIVSMRGSQPSTAKSQNQMMRVVKKMIRDATTAIVTDLREDVNQLSTEIQELGRRTTSLSDTESDYDCDETFTGTVTTKSRGSTKSKFGRTRTSMKESEPGEHALLGLGRPVFEDGSSA